MAARVVFPEHKSDQFTGFIWPTSHLCIACKPGGHGICHVSGALLRVRGHSSPSYCVGATGLTRRAPGKLGPTIIPHRRCFQPSLSLLLPDRLLRRVCPSCSFQLHTSALFSYSAGQVSVAASRPAPRVDSPPLQGRGGGGSPAWIQPFLDYQHTFIYIYAHSPL